MHPKAKGGEADKAYDPKQNENDSNGPEHKLRSLPWRMTQRTLW
jgi:hypothetical protein